MYKYIWVGLCYLLLSSFSFGQNTRYLKGYVKGKDEAGKLIPLPQASVLAYPGKTGTLTDEKGYFQLQVPDFASVLIVNYPSYQTDSFAIEPSRKEPLELILRAGYDADSVLIEAEKASTSVDPFKAQLTENLGRGELLKAACCNLGESFETNASVDVQFDDALTGSKQIQLLGLAGPYSQITIESMPGIRGVGSRIGLELIPGPWIESIQISKGAGSVVNGYEGFVGQINVEWEKPQSGRKLYVNGYGNLAGRTELNLNTTHFLNEKETVGTSLLLHGNIRPNLVDRNGDNFQDIPTGSQINVVNRWYFSNKKNLEGQIGGQFVTDSKQSGEISDAPEAIELSFDTRQLRGWAKIGWVNPKRAGESLGLQLMAQQHEQDNRSNLNDLLYQGRQNSLYANLIYQNYVYSPNHQIRMGANIQRDDFEEFVGRAQREFAFTELVPGVFGEYTYKSGESFRLVAGLRGDFHNLWGFFLTPRLHLLLKPDFFSSVRISAGRGQRTASIFAENLGRLANQRSISLDAEFNPNGPTPPAYYLPPEIGWNAGINAHRDFEINYRPLQLRMEYFFTWFEQLSVVDMEDPRLLRFYSLDGQAMAHSFLSEAKLELHRRFTVKAAYKWQRTLIDYKEGRLDRPFLPRFRAFVNGAYSTRSKWSFDGTLQLVGPQRIPSTRANPAEYRLPEYSPAFVKLDAQISKVLGKKWTVYVGGENLLNFRQENPILAAMGDRQFFDASLIWGPVLGRMVYGGFRFEVE